MSVHMVWQRFNSNIDRVIFWAPTIGKLENSIEKEKREEKNSEFVKIFILLIEVLVKITKLTSEKICTI